MVHPARLALGALLVLTLVLGARRLSPEIGFYDEGVYVVTAKALADGAGYRNVSLPDAPPHAKYPPLLPLALAGVWLLGPEFPACLVAMKGLVLAAALLLLAATHGYLRVRLDAVGAIAGTALLGLSPLFLVFATLATSDVPYALFGLAAVLCHERGRATGRPLALGAAMALAATAFLTRTVGALLLVALAADHLCDRRRGRAGACVAVAVAVIVPWVLWSVWATGAYADYPPGVRANYVGYGADTSSAAWLPQLGRIVGVNLGLLLLGWGHLVAPWAPPRGAGLAVVAVVTAGVLRHRSAQPRAVHLYCALYVASLLVVPYPDTTRYVLGVAPFLVAYVLIGLRALAGGWPAAWPLVAAAVVLAAAVSDLRAAAAPRAGVAQKRELREMLGWVRRELPADAVLVGDYDPVYFLHTGRRAIRVLANDNLRVYYARGDPMTFPEARELAEWFHRRGACHLVVDPMIGGREQVFFDGLLEAVRDASPVPYRRVYASDDGRFAVHSRAECAAP